MRRMMTSPLLLPAVLAAVLLAGADVPVPAAAQGSPAAFGAGIRKFPGGHTTFYFEARQLADGSVRGQLVWRATGVASFRATIDCLFIVGNRAVMSGTIVQASGSSRLPVTAGQTVLFAAADNGQRANGSPDLFDLLAFNADGVPFDCHNADDAARAVTSIDAGNITVRL